MKIRHLISIMVITILAAGCSDSRDDIQILPKPQPLYEPPAVTPMNVSGTWYSKASVNAVNCGMGETVDAKTVLISQDGAIIDMLLSSGDSFAGSVDGDIVEWAGSYAERGGSSDFTSATLVFSADSGSGNAAWTWSNGTDSCNGTMAIEYSKTSVVSESQSNSWPEIADLVVFTDGVAFLTGSLDGGADLDDYFRISLTEDAVIQAELSHFDTATADLDLVLLDSDLNEVTMSVTPDQFEIIEASVTAGDYYLHVDPATITGEQSYHLSIDLN